MNSELKYKLTLQDLFTNKMKDAIGQTSKLDGKINGLGSRMKGLGSTIATLGIGAAVVSFGKSVIDSLKNYEYFSASLRTLMHGDKNAASLLQSQLVDLAKTSPFSLVDVQDSSKKLLAYGFAAGEVTDQIKMLGDISSATGNNIGDVAYLYGTLKTQGRAMTKDLYQFTNRGINVIPLLAKHFKIAKSEVYKFAEQGKISFKDIERAFKSMTTEGGDFFGMMDEQSKTVGGKLSNLGDAWEQLKVTIGKSQTGIIASTTSFFTKMLGVFDNFLKNRDQMQQSFNKYGAVDYNFGEKYLAGINPFGKDTKAEDTRYQDAINKTLVEPSSMNLKQASQSKMALSNMILNMYQDMEARKDIASFSRTVAILKGSLAKVDENIAALKSAGFNTPTTTEGLTGEGKTAAEKSTEISGSRPNNYTINITKLIETQQITAQNIAESAAKVKEMVSKALLEAVNDVNLITR